MCECIGMVEITLAAGAVPALVELLSADGAAHAAWTSPESSDGIVRVYCEGPDEPAATARRIEARLTEWRDLLGGTPPAVRALTIRREDWSEAWKRHFHPFRASRRLVVKPSWEPYASLPGDVVIELDPGMAFGTGQHGTTRACLAFLDELAERLGPVSMLDVGCGSAILALAAARLGYRPVLAFDVDVDAVRVAGENLERAGVSGVVLSCADLAEFRPPAPCRVVVANILANTLIEHAERLCAFVDGSAPGGQLILSGILSAQYDEVRRHFAALGAEEQERMTLDVWTSGRFLLRSARVADSARPDVNQRPL
ncbi:MAG: Ribosomal protein L11 methyltransferase [Lentisphaerae bacterium ADurb.BinA184]|nr:MAG: Ribosomal protein L11 methyltransferase [Lentisphaerae bacterium ADurb.BinA184]